MATGAPALLRQARDIVAGAATDAAGLDAAFALLRRAAAADHRWPDGGLALHRVGYNLLAHWVRRADHSRAVAVADHVLQGIAAAAGVSAGCPGPDDLAALEERAAGWKFVAAWACCFRARGMAGLQPTLETLEYAVAHSVPWVLHYDVLDAEQAKGLRCHCIQALHGCLLPLLRAGDLRDALRWLGRCLPLLLPGRAGAQAGGWRYVEAWAAALLDRSVALLTAYSTAVASAKADVSNDDAISQALDSDVNGAGRCRDAEMAQSIGLQLLCISLAHSENPLPDMLVTQLRRIIDIDIWTGHAAFTIFGLRLLCASHRRAVHAGALPAARRALVATLNELTRWLVLLGYPAAAGRVHAEAVSVSEGLLGAGPDAAAAQLCHWDTAITEAYLRCEERRPAEANTAITAVFAELHLAALRLDPGQASDAAHRHEFGRLRVRCHYYLSLIHCKTGAFDRSLPLAEDCLSCVGLVGADREAFIDYSPSGYAEQAEMVDVFFQVIALHCLMGCPGAAQHYIDQVRRLCQLGLRQGDWIVSRHLLGAYGLARARLLKLQHETEPAVVALHGVLRWQPSVASAPVSGASPDEQPSPTSPSLCAQGRADTASLLQLGCPENRHLHLHLRCCLELGDTFFSAGDAAAAADCFRAAERCCDALRPCRFLQYVSDMAHYYARPPSFAEERLPDAAVDSFMDDLEGGEFPEGRTARMFLGCALLRLPAQEAEGLRLLKETVPLLEDASLSKSIGYYHLGISSVQTQWMFDAWMCLLEESKLDSTVPPVRQSSETALAEAFRHQRRLLPVPQTRRLCLALGALCGRRDSAQAAYYLNMALGTTLRHQMEAAALETLKRRCLAPASAAAATQEFVEHILRPHTPLDDASADADHFLSHLTQQLPDSLAVCTLCLSDDRRWLYAVRLEYNAPRVVLALSLVSGEGDGNLLLDAADRLATLLQANRVVCKTEARSKADIKAWHEARVGLDRQLGELLADLQRRLLGCWRGLLLGAALEPRRRAAFERVAAAGAELLRAVLRRAGHAAQQVDAALVRTLLLGYWPTGPVEGKEGQAVVSGLAALLGWEAPFSAGQLDELLAVYDALQSLCTSATEEGDWTPDASRQHCVLILDGPCHPLPWESLPALAGQSISRVPSLYYLGLQLAKYERGAPPSLLRDGVDADRVFFMLDPENDLHGTKERFGAYFAAKPAWQGLVGTAPTPVQFQAAMADYDCLLYLGHGSGDRYLSRAAVRTAPRCGVVMLIGCSSGRLSAVADLDPHGAPLNYLLAGSPCVVSNLWDVTDKEIDKDLGRPRPGGVQQRHLPQQQAPVAARLAVRRGPNGTAGVQAEVPY
eukprot:EG_transcript_686